MKRLTMRSCGIPAAAVLCLASVLRIQAQTAPAAGPIREEPESTIVLSPFVVEASEDSGYAAKDTLAGTRVRTEIRDSSSAISVVTKQFLQDTGSKTAQDLLVYTTSTEVGGLRGNFSGQGGASVYQEVLSNPNSTTRVRGLDSADNTRDYFLTDIPFDTFNVDRIDMQRGPNSILFGVGSPAGIINSSLNPASFKTAFKFENVTSSYGSQRNLIDLNYAIVPQTLGVRFAALNSQQRYEQKPAYNNNTRYYGALRFTPKIFGEGSHTSLTANYEHGKTASNNPRTLPPEDEITPFFQTGTDQYGNVGLDRRTINQYIPGNSSNSSVANGSYNRGGFAQGRTYWPTALSYFNGSNPVTPGVSPSVTSSVPTNVISGMINTGWRINPDGTISPPSNPGSGPATGGISGLPNFRPLAIPNYQQWAANSNLPGGSYYADVVLTDPSIFDFYKKLLDGTNKHEYQAWDAYNVALSQTFFNDRLGFELAYNNQEYKEGQVGFLQGVNYGINIDPNVVLTDGSINPNVGRPYVANSAASGNTETNISRNTTRLTVYGDVRAEDFLGKTKLARFLGRHVFTGLYNIDNKTTEDHQWSQYATDLGWETLNNLQTNTKISNYRQFDWVAYIGPTLAGATSATNSHLSQITNTIAPASTSSVRYFNSHWNKSSVPTDVNYVDPAAVYTYLNSDNGTVVNSTQNNNPANYVGWQNAQVNWLSANNPADFPALVTGGKTLKFKDTSKALTWQGYFLDNDLAVTYGWRKDEIVNYATAAPVDNIGTGVTALNYGTDFGSRETVNGQSRTWGAVYHMPKALSEHLPGHTGLSIFYNHGDNFKADILRTNLAGQKIPNANGETKEYGFTITTLDDKLSLKVNKFDTLVKGATFNVTNGNSIAGLGGNGYWLWAAPSWGYGYAANLQYGLQGHYGNATGSSNAWNYAYQDAVSAGADAATLAALADPNGAAFKASPQYAQEQAIVAAWLALPVSDGFFNYFGISPTINPAKAHTSGNLYDAFANWNNGAPVGGQQPGAINAVSTVDNHSTGWEYELVAQPTKNWNVTVNYVRTEATKTNIDPATVKFMADNLAFFNGPGGQLRLWGVGNFNSSRTQQIGFDWVANIYNAYQVSALAAGQSAPEVSPWRLNLVTTYNFDTGMLKNAFVGGGLRMEAGRILGYAYDPTTFSLDVTKPFIGSNDNHFDLWVGYSKKFSNKLKWRIQLNLRDVGESTKLVASRYQPNGMLALARIQDGMSWQLTNSIEF